MKEQRWLFSVLIFYYKRAIRDSARDLLWGDYGFFFLLLKATHPSVLLLIFPPKAWNNLQKRTAWSVQLLNKLFCLTYLSFGISLLAQSYYPVRIFFSIDIYS